MITWWNNLSFIGQILALLAIPSTIILFLQTIMTAVSGFGGDSDADVDFDSDTDFDFDTDSDIDIVNYCWYFISGK